MKNQIKKVFRGVESYGRLKVTIGEEGLDQKRKREIVICSENCAARNLLSSEDIEDEKNSFHKLVKTVWLSNEERHNKIHKTHQEKRENHSVD